MNTITEIYYDNLFEATMGVPDDFDFDSELASIEYLIDCYKAVAQEMTAHRHPELYREECIFENDELESRFYNMLVDDYPDMKLKMD